MSWAAVEGELVLSCWPIGTRIIFKRYSGIPVQSKRGSGPLFSSTQPLCSPVRAARRDEPRERSAAMKLRCKMWKERVDDVSRPMRRAVISAAGAAGLMMINGGVALAASDDEGVTAPEDLMKEHGVLNRCLLIYEGAIRRMETKEE